MKSPNHFRRLWPGLALLLAAWSAGRVSAAEVAPTWWTDSGLVKVMPGDRPGSGANPSLNDKDE